MNMRLSEAQELALYQWIDTLDKLNISSRPAAVLTTTHSILCEGNPGENQKLGAHWLKYFIERHPEYNCVQY